MQQSYFKEGVTSKRVAQQMERLVRRIAEKGLMDTSWHELLDALKSGKVELPDLLKADSEGCLDEFRRMLSDPLLEEAIRDFQATDPDEITRHGLIMLIEMAEHEFGKIPGSAKFEKGRTSPCCVYVQSGREERGATGHSLTTVLEGLFFCQR